MVNRIYSSELQPDEVDNSNTDAQVKDLYLSSSNGFVSCKIINSAISLILIYFIVIWKAQSMP